MPKNYVLRGDWYHYLRRVPKKVAVYDQRPQIRVALKTKDEKEAQRIASIYDDFIEEYWGDLIRSEQVDDDQQLFQQACAVAKAHGFAYKNIAKILDSPLDETLSRIESVSEATKSKRRALLGNSQAAQLKLDDCLQQFWPLCADRFTKKNERQIRKYKNPRILAMKNLILVVGNIDLTDFERSHALRFRKWLMERIEKGEIGGDAANKQMRHAKDVLYTVGLDKEIDMDFKLLFAELRFTVEENSKPPFEASYVQDILLSWETLRNMDPALQAFLCMIADTGARETEILTLNEKEDIILDGEIPFIWIRENQYWGLKNNHSERKIPLVGASLAAARQFASSGIARYRSNPDSAPNAVNKYLRENDLKPTPKHTLGSLRHTFKDRLRAVQAEEKLIDALMGHKEAGPKYGSDDRFPLEIKYKWLKEIAFKPPDEFR